MEVHALSLGFPRDVMVKLLDSRIVVSEFKLQLGNLRSLLDKYPWKKYEPPYPPSYGLNSTFIVLLEEWIWY